MSLNKDKSDLMGIFLLILSILIFGLLIYHAIKYPFLSNDEWFTLGIINLSIPNMVHVTAMDVHPPLFYLILYGFINFFKLLSINIDLIYVMKITAMFPYIILFIVALTKIRKDYGLLTAGLFSFTLISMCNFFTYFLISRMYSWALLVVVLAFISLIDVIEKGNLKYWILLTLFALIAAYLHYFAAIPIVVMYLALFIYLIAKRDYGNFKSQLKKYFLSVVIAILCYLPWSFILLGQMKQVQNNYHIHALTMEKIINNLSYYLSISNNHFIQLAACAIILVVFLIFIWKYYKTRSDKDFFIALGVFVFLATIGFAIFASLTYKPILVRRYLFPAIGVLWLCISIKLGSVDFKKIALPVILLILIIGAFNVYHQHDIVLDKWDDTLYAKNITDSINNNDSVIIIPSTNKYCRFNELFDNVSEKHSAYVINNKTHVCDYDGLGLNDDPIVIPDYLIEHPDKNVYIPIGKTAKTPKGDGFKFTSIGTVQNSNIYKIELV